MNPFILSLALFIFGLGAVPAHAQRAIPDDNLSYPVLITSTDGGTGSGFFINAPNSTYLVTARHVVYNRETRARRSVIQITAYGRDPKDSTKFTADVNLVSLDKAQNLAEDQANDIVVARLGKAAAHTESGQRQVVIGPGVAVQSSAQSGFVGAGMDTIKRFDDVLVSNPVFIFGYPRSIGVQQSQQFDPDRPLLRSGIVAGKNSARKTIIIDCPSYPGNSGGPVVQLQEEGLGSRRLHVVGVVREFVPVVETWENKMLRYTNITVTNSGYTVAAAMDAVLALVDRLEKRP